MIQPNSTNNYINTSNNGVTGESIQLELSTMIMIPSSFKQHQIIRLDSDPTNMSEKGPGQVHVQESVVSHGLSVSLFMAIHNASIYELLPVGD